VLTRRDTLRIAGMVAGDTLVGALPACKQNGAKARQQASTNSGGVTMPQTFEIERNANTVTLTMKRAHCLNIAGKREIARAITELGRDESIRSLILTSEHPEALLVDVAELVDMTPAQARAFSQGGHDLADALGVLPFPVIAGVDGPALGGGCELVMSCDITIAGANAKFGQIEANGGVIPGFGGTWRLARRVGFQRACEMIFTAAIVDAPTAAAYGLVLEAVPSDALMGRCRQLADRISKVSRRSVAEAKRVLVAAWGLPPSSASAIEQSAFASLFGSDDQRGRMRAFLAEQGKK
jgi:enoyl-CoA hydratase